MDRNLTAGRRDAGTGRVRRALTSTPTRHTRYYYADGRVCFAVTLHGGAYYYSARSRGYVS